MKRRASRTRTRPVCRKAGSALAKKSTKKPARRKAASKLRACRKAAPKRKATARRKNPSSSTEARVIGSRTVKATSYGVSFRRRFLLVRTGSALDWIEVLPGGAFGGAVEAPAPGAVEVSPTAPRAALVAAFRAYVARRGSAW